MRGPVRPSAMRLAFLLAVLLIPSLAAAKVNAGDRAVDFTLKSMDGKTVKLSSLKGKVVLVDFWASWCVPCKKELPALDKLQGELQAAKKDIVIITINIDQEKANAEKFLKGAGVKHLVTLLDPEGSVAGQYDLPTMPTSYVIDKKGIVKAVHAGYEPGDEKKLAKELEALAK